MMMEVIQHASGLQDTTQEDVDDLKSGKQQFVPSQITKYTAQYSSTVQFFIPSEAE